MNGTFNRVEDETFLNKGNNIPKKLVVIMLNVIKVPIFYTLDRFSLSDFG